MYKVGVTGGIGSGKTLVCNIFNKLGIPVFNADAYAKQLLDTDLEIIETFKKWFGADIYQPNGTVYRKKLAEIIFNDKFALQNVNNIVHPKVRNGFQQWVMGQNSPYVIQEAAILFENNQIEQFDKIVTVTAPVETKIVRVMLRDGIGRDKVLERMNNQMTDEEKIKQSDFVIENDNNSMILKQILDIHNKLK